MTLEPGLDLHDWETRWQELQDAAVEAPYEALPELVRLSEQMLLERGYDLRDPVAVEGDEAELVRDLLGAREVAAACEAGNADPGDVAAALENLADIHDHLVQARP